MKFVITALSALTALVLASFQLSADDGTESNDGCFRIGFSDQVSKSSPLVTKALDVVEKHFSCVVITPVSARRSLTLLQNNQQDADFSRIKIWPEASAAKIVRIDPAWMHLDQLLICSKGVPCSREDVLNEPVVYLKTYLLSSAQAKAFPKSIAVNTLDQLLSALQRPTINYALVDSGLLPDIGNRFPEDISMHVLEHFSTHIWVSPGSSEHLEKLKIISEELRQAFGAVEH